jgi:murein DD-endopeptidase MepM/ murein hydrolase activator NlpD
MALCLPSAASAAVLEVLAPANVLTGTAFVIEVITDSPESVKIEWQNARVMLTPKAVLAKNDTGLAEDGAVQHFSGQALLPVGINAEVGVATLHCSPAHGAAFAREIAITGNTFASQELTVEGKFVNPPKKVEAQIKKDREHNAVALRTKSSQAKWELPFYRPVSGSVSSTFGLRRVFNKQPRNPHLGLDLRGATGTPIRACASGTVLLSEKQYYSGNCVYIDHGMGVITTYLHMSETRVQPGQAVERGQVIGLVGATGRVTGPHLHLGVYILGTAVDPLPLLGSASAKPLSAK